MDKPRGEGAWWRSAGQRRTWVTPTTPSTTGTGVARPATAGGSANAPGAGDPGVHSLIDGVLGDTVAAQRTAVAAPPKPRQPIQWPPRPEVEAPAQPVGRLHRLRGAMRGQQHNAHVGLRTRTRVVIVLALTAAVVVAAIVTTRALAVSTSTNFASVLAAETPVEMNFQNAGILQSVAVTPGETVTPGQILATEEDAVQAQAVKSAQLQLASDTERLGQLLGKSAALAEQQAAAEYTKVQTLASSQEARGAASVAEESGILQAAQTREQSVSAQLAADQATYNSKCNGLGHSDCAALQRDVSQDQVALSSAESDVSRAEAALNAAQGIDNNLTNLANEETQLAQQDQTTFTPTLAVEVSQARDAVATDLAALVAAEQALQADTIVSPTSGKVQAVAGVADGTEVGPDGAHTGGLSSSSSVPGSGGGLSGPSSVSQSSGYEPLVTIDAAPGLEAIAQVPETVITSIRTGETATVTVDALGGKAFGAVVAAILQIPVDVQGSVYYDVVLVPAAGSTWPGNLLPGMTATVSVG